RFFFAAEPVEGRAVVVHVESVGRLTRDRVGERALGGGDVAARAEHGAERVPVLRGTWIDGERFADHTRGVSVARDVAQRLAQLHPRDRIAGREGGEPFESRTRAPRLRE